MIYLVIYIDYGVMSLYVLCNTSFKCYDFFGVLFIFKVIQVTQVTYLLSGCLSLTFTKNWGTLILGLSVCQSVILSVFYRIKSYL